MRLENITESGSIVRHLAVLLMLGAGGYFGVKAFYQQIDGAVLSSPGTAASVEIADAGPDPAAGRAEPVDREAISRRNIFLPKRSAGQGDYSAELLNSLQPAEPDLVLMGTIIEKDGTNRAVILDVENKKQNLLKEGDVINGASIRQISPGKVVVSRQGKNELLDISEARRLRIPAARPPNLESAVEFFSGAAEDDAEAGGSGTDAGLKIDMNRLQQERPGIVVKGRVYEQIEQESK